MSTSEPTACNVTHRPGVVADVTHDSGEDFQTFVRRHWSSLMTVAVAVTGSRLDAEDAVQTALSSAYPHWSRIRPDEALAYLRRSIVNAHISRWRRHRGREITTDAVPERAGDTGTDETDVRHTLLLWLRRLPERQRAVLVLRYLLDLSDEEIATTLGIAPATVRSQAHRGLATLRAQNPDREALL